jgi:hypothetical protein
VPLASSSFDVDTEGWVVEDFPVALGDPPVSLMTYSASYETSGGNPGGFIRREDPSGNWFWFSAPSAFLGDKSAGLGGAISLDMRVSPAPMPIGPIFPMVILVGGGTTLFAITEPPGSGFTSFEVFLTPCSWKVGNYSTGPLASSSQLLAVLGDLDALYISGDWVDGTETADLDNVRICGPEAPTVCTVAPTHGPNTGLSDVVISGTGFLGASAVQFGPSQVSFVVDSDTQITVDLGLTDTVGFVDVSVTTSSGTGTRVNAFDYFAPPGTIGGPCGAAYLTWSGCPTLGETFTVTTENLGPNDHVLLIDHSNIPNPRVAPYLFGCRVFVRPDQVVFLGNEADYSIPIPQDTALIGVHLLIQSLVRTSPSTATQSLDVLIGE